MSSFSKQIEKVRLRDHSSPTDMDSMVFVELSKRVVSGDVSER
jgi:hypothetical protein